MPGINYITDGISGVTGTAKLAEEYADPAEPEHKMYSLTADIVYKMTTAVRE